MSGNEGIVSKDTRSESNSNNRVATGINGFDTMVEGGLPVNSINTLTGPAGSGKTLFCNHFVDEGASRSEKSLYITLDQDKKSMYRSSRQYGMSMKDLVESGHLDLQDYNDMISTRSLGSGGDNTLPDVNEMIKKIKMNLNKSEIDRLVIDSISGIGIADKDNESIRRKIFKIVRSIRDNDVTAILVTEKGREGITNYGVEQFLTDSLIQFDMEQEKKGVNKTINIAKMRFTDHDKGIHPMEINDSGLVIHNNEDCFSQKFEM